MNVGVIGAGTMGAGIAQVAAQNGCTVFLFDTNQAALDKAKADLQNSLAKLLEKGKIDANQKDKIIAQTNYCTQLSDLKPCDLVIEAIVENLEIKKKVFAELEAQVSEQCILATNTSSLSITSIAAACKLPQRIIGIHFFNPAPVMALVEIVPAVQTSAATLDEAKHIIDAWGKVTVVAKDTPGFIVNRIARPYYSEALRIYDEGIADFQFIDQAMQTQGFKMGPFKLMDLIGHDVNYVVTETVWTSMYYDPRYKPSITQKRLLEAGWLGKKTGWGFYTPETIICLYSLIPEAIEPICNRILVMLFNEAADAVHYGIASEQDIELAMTKGVNYPKGLLAWAREFGIERVVAELDHLYDTYREDRYRCSVWLRNQLKA